MREEAMPTRIRRKARDMFSRETGFSGPELHAIFQEFDPDVPDYAWSGGGPSRRQIFDEFLERLPPAGQRRVVMEMLKRTSGRYAPPSEDGKVELTGMLAAWAGSVVEPSDVVVAIDWHWVQENWRTAADRLSGDPDGAITAARALVETVCKHILKERGASVPTDGDLAKLHSATATVLGLVAARGANTGADRFFAEWCQLFRG